MKNLSINLSLSLTLFFSSLVIADAKILTCEGEWDTSKGIQSEKWTALFDTNDFSKDDGQYEFTFLRNTTDPENVGKTYRHPMSATPSTLSFTYCPMPSSIVTSNCKSRGDGYSYMSTKDVSRKDLTYREGKCEIADYGAGNAL
jgi:hypothetical protein